MWMRNVLFLGLVIAGLGLLTAALFQQPAGPPPVRFDAAEAQTAEFRAAVDRVNAAFRVRWTEAGLKPAPAAPDLAVARRLSLALTGTIPSVQEIRQLERQGGDLVQWWLAGLLQDRRYADYFAERLARTYVGTEDGPFIFYRRRRFVSWLSDELMKKRPYDELVRELIAGKGLWTDHPATNFVSVTLEPANQKGPNPVRLAGRVSRAFLGVRFDCAECHNHPFASWKQSDFEGLAAFFGQTKHGFVGIYDDDKVEYQVENRKTGKTETKEPHVPFLDELWVKEGTRREQLAAWVTHPRNTYFAQATVNRVWALLVGRPLVEPVDDVNAAGTVPPALGLLAADFVAHGYDLQRLIRLIAATEVFRLDSAADHDLTDEHEAAWASFPLTRLRPEQVIGGLLQSSQLETIDNESHFFVRMARFLGEKQFVQRYGDTGEDEFDGRGGTIPQRLLLMNGEMVKERTHQQLFNAATRIGWLASSDAVAVETAYLAVLTRRPTAEEAAHFEGRLAGTRGDERSGRMEDLYWTLLNSTEFSWNH